MNKFLMITNLLSGLLLIRFSLSKLFAWPVSVEAFIEMAKPLGIDPTLFRLFTGVIISITCIGYLFSFVKQLRNKKTKNIPIMKLLIMINLLGVGVMSGALVAEFWLRVNPKWPLVFIALFIATTSLVNVVIIKNLNEKQGVHK